MSFFDQFRDINRVISFTPANIFEAMGRTWELGDDDFHYSNNPNDRFNREYNNKMREEWDWRVREAEALEHKLASVGLKRPKKVLCQCLAELHKSLILLLIVSAKRTIGCKYVTIG